MLLGAFSVSMSAERRPRFERVQRMLQSLRASEVLAARLESRVVVRMRELDAANQAQSRFLAAASQDLRQPVAAIGLLVGLARERVQATDARGPLDRAQDAAGALDNLLHGLLDLSRLGSEAAAPKPQAVPLQHLFDAIAAHELPAAQAKGLQLRCVPARQVVVSDPVLLEQVLRSLVGNALRDTTRGNVLVAARPGAQGEADLATDAPALAARFAQQGLAVLHKPFRAEALLQHLLTSRAAA